MLRNGSAARYHGRQRTVTAKRHALVLLATLATLAGCATRFAPVPRVPMPRPTTVPRCEAVHALRGNADRVDTRVERLEEGWIVSLRMHLELGEGVDPVDLYGLGMVSLENQRPRCQVLEAGAAPGSPRFDEDLCLDAVESIADIIDAAERAAQPGQTIIEEGRVSRTSIQRRSRSRRRRIVVVRMDRGVAVTRDAQGRVINVVQESAEGSREYVQVHFSPRLDAHCIPTW